MGVVLSVIGLIVLLVLAWGRPWHIVSFSIYGASLIFLYTASAIYHSFQGATSRSDYVTSAREKVRALSRLQRLDHGAIYGLILGTYVPVCLVTLRGGWGWTLLGLETGLASFGVVASIFWKRAPDWLRVTLYIVMGWLALIAMGPLRTALPPSAIAWLVGGGVIYSVGTVIYALDRPHLWPGKFSAHDLWHLFVMGGSACHFVLMLRFIAPAT
jgi:hemolysin III